jgi:hypothetical protein
MVGRVSSAPDGARLEIRIRSREQLEDLIARLEQMDGVALHKRAA